MGLVRGRINRKKKALERVTGIKYCLGLWEVDEPNGNRMHLGVTYKEERMIY
jgi:hypothetical protein